MSNSDDDDVPQLSAHTLAALQEFMAEQNDKGDSQQENWQLSQFWYNEETSERLAREAMAVAGDTGRIACVSCPTLYKKLLQLKSDTCRAVVLEYDKRFDVYGQDFIFYDFNNPLHLDKDLQNSFDLVVADPPFLSEECLRKTAQTVKYLTKQKVLLCTGAIMEELAADLLDAQPSSFLPQHENNLANEFRCYANYKTYTLDNKPNKS